MGFVANGVYRLMMFVGNDVCHLITFAQYDVCGLQGLSQDHECKSEHRKIYHKWPKYSVNCSSFLSSCPIYKKIPGPTFSEGRKSGMMARYSSGEQRSG